MRLHTFLFVAILAGPAMIAVQSGQGSTQETNEEVQAAQVQPAPSTEAGSKPTGVTSAPKVPEGYPGPQANPPVEGKLFPKPGTAGSTDQSDSRTLH